MAPVLPYDRSILRSLQIPATLLECGEMSQAAQQCRRCPCPSESTVAIVPPGIGNRIRDRPAMTAVAHHRSSAACVQDRQH